MAERYRDAIAADPRLEGEDPSERRMREIFYLHLTRFVQMLLDRKDRMSMASGLEVRVPFCDHRLVDYVFNTPWRYKTFDGREKSLLRAATADLLPRSILERRKSPYPSTQDPGYLAGLMAETRQVLADPGAAVFELIDRERVRRLVEEPLPERSGMIARHGLEVTLAFDTWLREYRPRLLV